MPDERSPLLGSIHLPGILGGAHRNARVHYVDNLRAVLVILLILQHSVMESTQSGGNVAISSWDSVPLAIFLYVNKTFLWALFFFVAGYSSYLGHEKRDADYKFLLSRLLNLGLPALIWFGGGQFAVVSVLGYFGFGDVFPWSHGIQTRLAGPVPFIVGLLIFDFIYFLWRAIGNIFPAIEQTRVIGSISSSKFSLRLLAVALATIFIGSSLISIFVAGRLYPGPFYHKFIYDLLEAPSHPLGFVIAYMGGINFHLIKKIITFKSHTTALVVCTAISYISMGIAQHYSPLLWENIKLRTDFNERQSFIGRGFNFHTIFFVVWSTFVIYALPVSMVSFFFQSPTTRARWGNWTQRTYVQTYIHMIPILLANHYIPQHGIMSIAIVRSASVGAIGLSASWIAASAPAVLSWLHDVAK